MISIFLHFLILVFTANAYSFERKQEQFLTTPSYVIMPVPYQVPGVGSGWILYGKISNFALNYMDISAMVFSGAANGEGMGLHEIHIIPEFLFLDADIQRVRDVTVQYYNERGMDTDVKDYFNMYAKNIFDRSYRADLTFWNRRINFTYKYLSREYDLRSFLDSSEEEVTEVNASVGQIKDVNHSYNFFLDITNDFQDPTAGLRVSLTRTIPENESTLATSKYEVISQSYNLYIPVLKFSTIALNYFKSDAYIEKEGLTNTTDIRNSLGLSDCTLLADASLQAKCNEAQTSLINRTLAENKYGSAIGLGGRSRMRGFTMGRFMGSHTIYYGSEFRWNLDTSIIPFDWLLVKDTRSAIQIALFHEKGASGDIEEDLPDQLAESNGMGLRLVSRSGWVFRGDWGHSKEGDQYTLIGHYPW